MWAVRRDHIDVVKQLLSEGADVNVRTSSGIPTAAIPEAITDESKNRADIYKLLLDAGADIEVEGWQGETPLTMATSLGNVEYN